MKEFMAAILPKLPDHPIQLAVPRPRTGSLLGSHPKENMERSIFEATISPAQDLITIDYSACFIHFEWRKDEKTKSKAHKLAAAAIDVHAGHGPASQH